MLNKIQNTGKTMISTINMNKNVEIIFPKNIDSLGTGANNKPLTLPCSLSAANILVKPRMPPNKNDTHNMPGPTNFTVFGFGSIAKLNMSTTKRENTKIDTIKSLLLISNRTSFQKTAHNALK